MLISDLRKETDGEHACVRARVVWEDAQRKPLDLEIRTDAAHGAAMRADPSALLVACIVPAYRYGEGRVRVEGELCPLLRDGVLAALKTLKLWYPEEFAALPAIEASEGFAARYPAGQSVSLMSCGVDSMATLRWNKLNLPADHPAAIGAAIMLERERHPEIAPAQLALRNEAYRKTLASVAAAAGVAGIAAHTNLFDLCNDGYFYDEKWHAALLGGVAGVFSGAYQRAYIAASDEPADLHPWGSHPMLDSAYGSAHFQVEHHGVFMRRFAKIALIADWPEGLANLRVCQKDFMPENCGTCEKCIRTMTALAALGKLKGCGAFPADEVTPALLRTVQEYEMFTSNKQVVYFRELIEPLAARGRDDLAAVLREICDECDRKFGRLGEAKH
jgi:hypothetical protein